MLAITRPDRTVGAVGSDDQVAIAELVYVVELALELDRDADLAALLVQRLQQVDARHAVERVVRERDALSAVHDRHLVVNDLVVRDRVVQLRGDVAHER